MEHDSLSPRPDLQAVRQRRRSLHRSMANLENALAAPAVGRIAEWLPEVRAAITELQDCIRSHIGATEGPDGFHAEIVTAAPRLSHLVEISVHEHLRIVDLIAELLTLADQLPSRADVVADVRETGTALIGLLARHRQRGADMIFEAYQADLGGQD